MVFSIGRFFALMGQSQFFSCCCWLPSRKKYLHRFIRTQPPGCGADSGAAEAEVLLARYSMSIEVAQWCQACKRCQVAKDTQPAARGFMGHLLASWPHEILAIDFVVLEVRMVSSMYLS